MSEDSVHEGGQPDASPNVRADGHGDASGRDDAPGAARTAPDDAREIVRVVRRAVERVSRLEPHASLADVRVAEENASRPDHVRHGRRRSRADEIFPRGDARRVVEAGKLHRLFDGERHAEERLFFFARRLVASIEEPIDLLGLVQRGREAFVDVNVQVRLDGSDAIDVETNDVARPDLPLTNAFGEDGGRLKQNFIGDRRETELLIAGDQTGDQVDPEGEKRSDQPENEGEQRQKFRHRTRTGSINELRNSSSRSRSASIHFTTFDEYSLNRLSTNAFALFPNPCR